MPLPYKVLKNAELLRFKPSSTRFCRVCSPPLTEDEAERSTFWKKAAKVICTFVALTPAMGAVLSFIYGPSFNRGLARLAPQRNATVLFAACADDMKNTPSLLWTFLASNCGRP